MIDNAVDSPAARRAGPVLESAFDVVPSTARTEPLPGLSPPPTEIAPGLRLASQVALLGAALLVHDVSLRVDFERSLSRLALDLAASALTMISVAAVLLALIEYGAKAWRHWRASVRIGLTFALCWAGVFGLLVGTLPLRAPLIDLPPDYPDWIVIYSAAYSAGVSALVLAVHELRSRRRESAQMLHEAQLQRLQLEQQVDAAQLALLQAQIEPHFIFNSLANVRRLLRSDAAAARALCDDLLRYLEQALPSLRAPQVTLGREVDLARAYLAVHQVRMGTRLRFEIDVPPALVQLPVPSMTLLTLVENALKHGLQPLVEGGVIRVSARAEPPYVVLRVDDNGRGMGSASGRGTGLANLRARLRLLYGDAASLALALNEPRGVGASVTLPLQPR